MHIPVFFLYISFFLEKLEGAQLNVNGNGQPA